MEVYIMSYYTEKYEQFTPETIQHIEQFSWSSFKSINFYKSIFMTFNPDASEDDFSNWYHHFRSSDWQNDIWTMTDADFKYHWPVHAAYFDEISQ